jgi:hypothetical protein
MSERLVNHWAQSPTRCRACREPLWVHTTTVRDDFVGGLSGVPRAGDYACQECKAPFSVVTVSLLGRKTGLPFIRQDSPLELLSKTYKEES